MCLELVSFFKTLLFLSGFRHSRLRTSWFWARLLGGEGRSLKEYTHETHICWCWDPSITWNGFFCSFFSLFSVVRCVFVLCVESSQQMCKVVISWLRVWWYLFVFFFLWLKIHHLVNFLRTVAQKALKITDKSVDVAFASCFEDDVLVIVVPTKVQKIVKLSVKAFLKWLNNTSILWRAFHNSSLACFSGCPTFWPPRQGPSS